MRNLSVAVCCGPSFLSAVAVNFDFVHPLFTDRRSLMLRWVGGFDEVRKRRFRVRPLCAQVGEDFVGWLARSINNCCAVAVPLRRFRMRESTAAEAGSELSP